MINDLKRLAKHGGIYMIGNILNRVGAFILLPLYTNYLTTAQYGGLELFYSVSAIISVLVSAGLSHATLRFYFEYEKKEDRDSVIITNFVLALVLAVVGVTLVSFFSENLLLMMFENTEYKTALYFLFTIIVLEISSEVLLSYLRAKEYSLKYVGLSIVKLFTQVTFSIYFVAVLSEDVEGILRANLISQIVGWLFLLGIVVKECKLRLAIDKLYPILRYSIPFVLSMIVGTIAVTADKFILKSFASLEAVGLYALGVKFALILQILISEPFYRSYGSFRFSIMEQDNAADIQAIVTKYMVTVGLFVGLGLSLYTPEVLQIMSPKEFWIASTVVPILALAIIMENMNYTFQTGILYKKNTRYIFYLSLLDATSIIILNLILVPVIGMYGSALAMLIGSVIYATATNLVSQKYFRVKYYYKDMMTVIALTVVVYGVSLLITFENIFISIAVKAIFIGIFLIFTYILDDHLRDNMKYIYLLLKENKEKKA